MYVFKYKGWTKGSYGRAGSGPIDQLSYNYFSYSNEDFKQLREFHGLLAKVFDKFSDAEENSIEILEDCDWLFDARSMHKWPNLQKGTGWKSIGILSASNDQMVPDFKGTMSRVTEDESKAEKWYSINNLSGG